MLLGLLACTACGSYPEVVREPPPDACAGGELETCDVLNRACQRRLMEYAACLRGCEPAELPPVQRLTPWQCAQLLNQANADESTTDRTHWEKTLAMLRLVDPTDLPPTEFVVTDLETTVALYRSVENDIILVDHGQPADDALANHALVHEFIHALQDLDYDLPSFYEAHGTTYDSYLAANCVVEGEATYHGLRAAATLLALDTESLDWDRRVAADVARSVQWALEQPSPYRATWASVPYAFGERLVHTAWSAGGYSEVIRLFAAPPHTMQPVLADPQASAPFPSDPVELPEPEAPAELTLDGWDALGAWGLVLVLAAAGMPVDDALVPAVAVSWRGDRIWVYAAEESTVAVLRLELADEAAAQTTEAWLAGYLPATESAVVREGERVVLAVTDDPSLLGDWALAL
jgi:hypothetical protein